MRLYRLGDQGEPVRDIQDRLNALGYGRNRDDAGTFGPGTESAVRTFQAARGIGVDGIVGPDTWRAMVAAGYTLGDRLLYHRVPMMRGDDVADLQRRLNSLGFDPGKIDGIFGPDTLDALLDFQSNRRMPEDGIAGREVADELALMARATQKHGRDVVLERKWIKELPNHVAGQRVYVDAFCRSAEENNLAWEAALTFGNIIQDLGAHVGMSRSADTSPPERVRALRANRFGADLVVAFSMPDEEGTGEPAVYYFSSSHTSSHAGALLAKAVAEELLVPCRGRATPMLKNTRSPAIVIAPDKLGAKTGGQAAQGLINLFAQPAE
ncbi:MAG: hypothetical protein HKN91_11725 [Acidimicrobiia bacterium]|nr:hypothetical protein [Acidimicrobiia bacterium]